LKENPVKRALESGGRVVGSFLVEFNTLGMPRMLAAAGADFVMFDQEHTAWPVESLKPLIVASHAAGIVPLVRVPAVEHRLISAVLDAGAMGVMAPMIESVEQAEAVVLAAKYPPAGRRGLGPFYADELDADIVSTMRRIDREQLLIAMVETAEGVANVDEIAGVEGIDLLWVGHGDLTTSLGIPGRYDDPRYLDALERILAAAQAHGKPVGFMAVSAEEGRQLAERGFRCIAFGDRPLYERALREAHAAARDG
jgi:2-keto-3-deoxy-L-rhamnonate aldolase RhmA